MVRVASELASSVSTWHGHIQHQQHLPVTVDVVTTVGDHRETKVRIYVQMRRARDSHTKTYQQRLPAPLPTGLRCMEGWEGPEDRFQLVTCWRCWLGTIYGTIKIRVLHGFGWWDW